MRVGRSTTPSHHPIAPEDPDEPAPAVTFDARDPQRALVLLARRPRLRPPGAARVELGGARTRWLRGTVPRAGRRPARAAELGSALESPEGAGPRIFFQQVPEDKIAKNRVHLVRAAPGLQGERIAALEAECARLVGLGHLAPATPGPAPPLSYGHIGDGVEGNEFCLD